MSNIQFDFNLVFANVNDDVERNKRIVKRSSTTIVRVKSHIKEVSTL